VIALALLLFLGNFGFERLRGSRPSVQGESIAVLPLTNESGDANEQYFSDGISEDVITALSQFPGLKVIRACLGVSVSELERGQPQHWCKVWRDSSPRGNARAALVAAQHEPPGFWRDGSIALARQIGSNRAAADAALRILIEKHAQDAPFQVADVYALRGDANSTFAWLERVWSNRDPSIATMLYDPFILRFKSDPRLAAFCRKVGLPAPGQVAARTFT
jgi:hypothetical protein